MGKRGETWVLAQLLLFVGFVLVPRTGPEWPHAGMFMVAGGLLAVVGIALLAAGAFGLGRSLTPFPKPLPDSRLVTGGVYRLVRHPIYCGILLAALGASLATASWPRLALTAVLFVFFEFKARREERWLLERYPDYAAYRRHVKKLIPWIY